MHHGERSTLLSADGFQLDAYRVGPTDARRGGLVVIQEIFGVNDHIKDVCDSFAADGYECIAPAIFDRQQREFEVGYDSAGMAAGRKLAMAMDWTTLLSDVQAAIDALAGPVFIVGYCLGGTVAYAAACRLTGLSAASCYYGGAVERFAGETPKVPTILHFGRTDAHIPMDMVERIRAAQPELPVHVYDAGHGFNCDRRPDFDQDSADLARLRTLQLFHRAASGGKADSAA